MIRIVFYITQNDVAAIAYPSSKPACLVAVVEFYDAALTADFALIWSGPPGFCFQPVLVAVSFSESYFVTIFLDPCCRDSAVLVGMTFCVVAIVLTIFVCTRLLSPLRHDLLFVGLPIAFAFLATVPAFAVLAHVSVAPFAFFFCGEGHETSYHTLSSTRKVW